MTIVSLLAGITLTIVGILIWKFKLVGILAGYTPELGVDGTRLATMSGLLLLMVGLLLLVESFLILKGIIMPEKAIFVVVGTIIIGVIVVAVVTSYYSKH
ncbi:DUF3784 domain-containing protein [Aerococcus christensenii]|uniref:DUF3784 domain-containing protein n=1 Tax=Aerococcus christensenii TaxID=87541 RepID=A0A2I1K8J6_9LACT|nr:DUF3784 domain-containing protein [Aerococcus christensenii]PKY91962.1 DUF3784 domain-containing protein [Aerococcus christensenii]